MQATRLLRIPVSRCLVSSGPRAPVGANSNTVAQSLREGVLAQGAGSLKGHLAGTERMRVRRLSAIPWVLCLSSLSEKYAWSSARTLSLLQISTLSHRITIHMPSDVCIIPEWSAAAAISPRLSHAVERRPYGRYRGCGRWRAPCRRRDRLRLSG